MRIKKEDEILNIDIRAKIIEEIEGTENKCRKDKVYRRQQIYKDQTYRYVIDLLMKQFDQSTVAEMQFSLANISIVKKIIDKLARVYTQGVDRIIEGDEANTEKLQELARILDFNTRMKNTNRQLELQRNVSVYIKPVPYWDQNDNMKYTVKVSPLSPYLYDVVEGYYDRTKPMVYILSNYDYDSNTRYSVLDAALEGRAINSTSSVKGDGRDQLIADTPEDENADVNNKEYIFWTDKYHFTTNSKGEIVSETIDNPIKELPFVNFTLDQDGSFWAEGGDDLPMGGVLINSMLTNINYIGVTQGYGQFWMKGKNLPRNLRVGPSRAVLMEYTSEDPTPDLGFASSNPQLSALMETVETYTALLLTTNNLSTSGVSTDLNGSNNFASGIALLIDKSESVEDVKDQEQIFKENEPRIWAKLNKWLEHYKSEGVLDPDYEDLVLPDDVDVTVIFPTMSVLLSEEEKLANLEKRKALGLNTMIEIIRKDQPDLTEEEAEAKLLKIQEEKTSKLLNSMSAMSNNSINSNMNDNSDDNDNMKDESDESDEDESDE